MTICLWEDIPGYEGLYQVSDTGQVKSLEKESTTTNRWGGTTVRILPERLMSPAANNAGYLHVTLRKDGGNKTFLVHRLVAAAFIPNPTNLGTVNHRNGLKEDNTVANLEWMDQRENNRHARTALPYRQHRHGVKAIKADGSELVFPSKIAAEKELCGKATGLISWALKHGRPALGMKWAQL